MPATKHLSWRKVVGWIAIAQLAVAACIVGADMETYHSNVASEGCCGWVSENALARPYTYLMVDEWTSPVWTQNGDGSQAWLTTEGIVSGKPEFWRIIETRDLPTQVQSAL